MVKLRNKKKEWENRKRFMEEKGWWKENLDYVGNKMYKPERGKQMEPRICFGCNTGL